MRPRSGFTLVELLLFTGIIAVMAGALVGFSLVSTNLSTRSEVTAEVEENAAVVSQRIIREVQNADIVASPQVLAADIGGNGVTNGDACMNECKAAVCGDGVIRGI